MLMKLRLLLYIIFIGKGCKMIKSVKNYALYLSVISFLTVPCFASDNDIGGCYHYINKNLNKHKTKVGVGAASTVGLVVSSLLIPPVGIAALGSGGYSAVRGKILKEKLDTLKLIEEAFEFLRFNPNPNHINVANEDNFPLLSKVYKKTIDINSSTQTTQKDIWVTANIIKKANNDFAICELHESFNSSEPSTVNKLYSIKKIINSIKSGGDPFGRYKRNFTQAVRQRDEQNIYAKESILPDPRDHEAKEPQQKKSTNPFENDFFTDVI